MNEIGGYIKKTNAEIKEIKHTQDDKCIESMTDWAARNTDGSLSNRRFSGHAD